ncbi:MAG: FAD-dependent oxidoreductase, partial [Bacteroidota bacterium]
QGDFSDNCSFGNAGMITPSHFVPLASPGVVAQGIRWMFKSSSPFFIRPRLDVDLLHWLWRFYRSCNRRQAEAAMPVLLDFNLLGKKGYRDFQEETGLDFKLEERGILMLYQSPKTEREEVETVEIANKLGIEAQLLNARQVQEMEPELAVKCLGGVFFPGDAHLHPVILMQHLKAHLTKQGVHFHPKKAVDGFVMNGKKVTAITCGSEHFPADQFLLTAGSRTAILLKKAGIRLLLQDGKGYSYMLKNPARRPRNASILLEARVAVTPMGDDLRFGGTLELSGHDDHINQNRFRGILEAIPKYYPGVDIEMPSPQAIWHGYRPCSPDGLPYIGRLNKLENVVVATGHAMMGLSLAPATGLMVRDLVTETPEVNFAFHRFFNPNRFG